MMEGLEALYVKLISFGSNAMMLSSASSTLCGGCRSRLMGMVDSEEGVAGVGGPGVGGLASAKNRCRQNIMSMKLGGTRAETGPHT